MNDHQLPEGWRWVRLGEACRVVGGSTPSSGVTEFWDGDIVWITPTDLGKLKGHLITDSSRRITESGYKSCGTELVPVGSVVLSSRAPIGHLGIAGVPLCTNQRCKTFVPGANVDSRFLFFSLRQAVPTLQSLGSGATFAEISKSELEGFEIALPPPSEQKRIAAILNEQMEAVEQARAAAEAQLAAAKALPPAYLRAVFSSPEAQQWPMRILGEVLTLRKDIVHPRDSPSGPATFVGLEHVESTTGKRIGSLPVEMSQLAGRKPRFYQGDIVYGYLRPYLNKVWVAEFDGLCSVDQYVYSVPAALADTEYVARFMRSDTFLRRAPVGDAPAWLPRIRTDEVSATQINLPSLDEQRRIAATASNQMASAERARKAIEEELDAINKLPAALLRRAFADEL